MRQEETISQAKRSREVFAKPGRRGQAACVFMATLFLLAVLFLAAPFPAWAQEADSRTGSLRILAFYQRDTGKTGKSEDIPAAGMRIRLYRTADLVRVSGAWSYQPVQAYSSVSVSYEKMTASQSSAAAKKLASVASRRRPDAEGVIGSNGALSLSGLAPGIYLAVQVGKTGKVVMAPCLWQVPEPRVNAGNGAVSWKYELEVRPKLEAVKQYHHHKKKTIVKTGDPSPSLLPYMISMAASSAAVILLLLRKRNNGGSDLWEKHR